MSLDYSGNLYTFGCSMTSYKYPTWADLLGRKFQYFENWGMGGAGNLYIFNTLTECLTRNKLKPNDNIIVMWSGLARIDYYVRNEWGHLTNQLTPRFNDDPISCPDGYEVISYSLFQAAWTMLKNINCNFKMWSWYPYPTNGKAGKLYHEVLKQIDTVEFSYNTVKYQRIPEDLTLLYKRLAGVSWPSLSDILSGNFQTTDDLVRQEILNFLELIDSNKLTYAPRIELDCHPTPWQHLMMLHKKIPEISKDSELTEYAQHMTGALLNNKKISFNKHFPPERL